VVTLQNAQPNTDDFGTTWIASLASNCPTPSLCAELRLIARGRAFVANSEADVTSKEFELGIIANTFPEALGGRLPRDTPPYRMPAFDASVNARSIKAAPFEPVEPDETGAIFAMSK